MPPPLNPPTSYTIWLGSMKRMTQIKFISYCNKKIVRKIRNLKLMKIREEEAATVTCALSCRCRSSRWIRIRQCCTDPRRCCTQPPASSCKYSLLNIFKDLYRKWKRWKIFFLCFSILGIMVYISILIQIFGKLRLHNNILPVIRILKMF